MRSTSIAQTHKTIQDNITTSRYKIMMQSYRPKTRLYHSHLDSIHNRETKTWKTIFLKSIGAYLCHLIMTKITRLMTNHDFNHVMFCDKIFEALRMCFCYPLGMERSPHILVVDDHREVRELLARFLSKQGFRVSVATDGRGMRKILEETQIDLIVLDRMLPGEDGLTLCRQLRSVSNISIIMLTAIGDTADRTIGLEVGADDYMAKPFDAHELLARIRAVLRRAQGAMEPVATLGTLLRFSNWRFHVDRRELETADGVIEPLSTGEFDLLMAFVQHSQRVLNRDQLLNLAYGRTTTINDRSIDTQVMRLRRKIEPDAKNPTLIKTVWGGGYIFTPEVIKER
ncbi:two-component system, OmpR family, phosphate regulon response regulator OmpR [Azospirillaceae bacterium]